MSGLKKGRGESEGEKVRVVARGLIFELRTTVQEVKDKGKKKREEGNTVSRKNPCGTVDLFWHGSESVSKKKKTRQREENFGLDKIRRTEMFPHCLVWKKKEERRTRRVWWWPAGGEGKTEKQGSGATRPKDYWVYGKKWCGGPGGGNQKKTTPKKRWMRKREIVPTKNQWGGNNPQGREVRQCSEWKI